MTHRITGSIGALLLLVSSVQTTAQSVSPSFDRARGEMRVTAGVTIPLGASPKREDMAPRFDIAAKRRDGSRDVLLIDWAFEQRWQERRIGITLNRDPRLMLNGQTFEPRGRRANVDDTVLIVGGVVIVALGVAFLVVADAASDASD